MKNDENKNTDLKENQLTTGRWIGKKKRYSKVESSILTMKNENQKKFDFNVDDSVEKSMNQLSNKVDGILID